MSTPSIALAALQSASLPNGEAVVAAINTRSNDSSHACLASQSAGAFTLGWDDGASANVTLVAEPIPWERLEGPCATAWYWPEAESVLRSHTSHLFVTLIDENRRKIDVSFRQTNLLSGLAEVAQPLGLIWGASGAVHEPKAFAGLASQSSMSDLPLNLWIDFRVYQRDASDGFGLFTTGLEALGRREFEVPHFAGDPQHLISATYNIAHYALEKDATLKDSEVIGLPDESQVTIREDQSMINPEQDVYRLEFS